MKEIYLDDNNPRKFLINYLSDYQRKIYKLYFVTGYSLKQTAWLLNSTEARVRNILYRGLRKIELI